MSVPTGSDASTAADESSDEQTDSAVETVRQWASAVETVRQRARHWRAWVVAAFSLAVAGWAAVRQPQTLPKGYIPTFLGSAAVGFVSLDEETQIGVASSEHTRPNTGPPVFRG